MGPVILDLLGTEVLPEEINLLQHPLVGGVILFTRNYQSPQQIQDLIQHIRCLNSDLIICVDHEGGRVQRFRQGFTQLPSMGKIGELYSSSPQQALQLAQACGWLMGVELGAVDVDFSFAPVLDLDKNNNPAISDRAFHTNPDITIALAQAFMRGMHEVGMAATGKHFPGHGSVKIDSHLALPEDLRHFSEVSTTDLLPFSALIKSGVDAIMPAHILFSHIDPEPVGFSHYWLQEVLRKQLNFSGVIISDDLNMKGACRDKGDYARHAQKALDAGCDAILICNNRAAAIEILESLPDQPETALKKMRRKTSSIALKSLYSSIKWQELNKLITNLLTQEIS